MGRASVNPWLDFHATPDREMIIDPYRFAPIEPSSVPGLVMELYGTNIPGAADAAFSPWTDPFAGSDPAQATGALRPIKKVGILNGMPVGRSSGTEFLATGAPVTTSQEHSMFLVFKHPVDSGNQILLYNGNSASNGYGIYIDGGSDQIRALHGGVGVQTLATDTDDWIIAGIRESGGTLNFRVSGNAGGSTAWAAPSAPTTATSVFNANGGDFFVGDIFAALIYDNDIGAANFNKVFTALSKLTGIPQ